MISIESDNDLNYDDFESREIAENTWAIFTSVGQIPDEIQNTMNKVYEEWLTASGFQHGDAPAIEVYFPGEIASDDYRCKLWIPIIEK